MIFLLFFQILEKYVQNTHATTHNLYTLDIVDIFKIDRKGEEKRFKPFKKLPNHKLLWHGSRTTNYAGITILSKFSKDFLEGFFKGILFSTIFLRFFQRIFQGIYTNFFPQFSRDFYSRYFFQGISQGFLTIFNYFLGDFFFKGFFRGFFYGISIFHNFPKVFSRIFFQGIYTIFLYNFQGIFIQDNSIFF